MMSQQRRRRRRRRRRQLPQLQLRELTGANSKSRPTEKKLARALQAAAMVFDSWLGFGATELRFCWWLLFFALFVFLFLARSLNLILQRMQFGAVFVVGVASRAVVVWSAFASSLWWLLRCCDAAPRKLTFSLFCFFLLLRFVEFCFAWVSQVFATRIALWKWRELRQSKAELEEFSRRSLCLPEERRAAASCCGLRRAFFLILRSPFNSIAARNSIVRCIVSQIKAKQTHTRSELGASLWRAAYSRFAHEIRQALSKRAEKSSSTSSEGREQDEQEFARLPVCCWSSAPVEIWITLQHALSSSMDSNNALHGVQWMRADGAHARPPATCMACKHNCTAVCRARCASCERRLSC